MPTSKYDKDIKFWEKDGIELLKGWARDGLNNDQMANNMGIGRTTFYKWQSKSTKIREAIKSNKKIIDYEVENAALKSALGFKETLEEKEYTVDENNNKKLIKIKQREIYFAPNPTMIVFWLRSRMGDKWREVFDTKDIETIKELAIGFDKISKLGNK